MMIYNSDPPEFIDDGLWSTDLASAPAACHVIACYWSEKYTEWIVDIIMSPPRKPWTHWQPLPNMPILH